MTEGSTAGWITVFGERNDPLCASMKRRVDARISAGEFSSDNIAYIGKVTFAPIDGELSVSSERLERLRRLCQLWDVRLRPAQITSHRKFIGPVIVAAKKLIYPILRAFLNDTLHQQRSFNAASIALMAELSEEIERLKRAR